MEGLTKFPPDGGPPVPPGKKPASLLNTRTELSTNDAMKISGLLGNVHGVAVLIVSSSTLHAFKCHDVSMRVEMQ